MKNGGAKFLPKALIFCLFAAAPLSALPSEIQATSQEVEIQDLEDCVFTRFSKDAKIFGDGFCIQGEVIEVVSDKTTVSSTNHQVPAIRKISAIGEASFEQDPYRGKGDKISINPQLRTLTIEGNAEISDRDRGTVRGEKLVLDHATKSIKIEGGPCRRSVISVEDIAHFRSQALKEISNGNDANGKN